MTSPDYPADYPSPTAGTANLGRSSGFEGMALSADGRKLYPALEGAVAGDDPQVRRVYEFDLRKHEYTGVRRTYRVGTPGEPATNGLSLSDLSALDDHRLVGLERDNNQGPAAAWKRAFVIELDRTNGDGTLVKRQVADLLNLRDPARISSQDARPGDIGLGDPFSYPYLTIEAVLPDGPDRLTIVNDTNFGSTGRNAARPDDSDFIQVQVPGLRRGEGEG